MRIEAGRLSLPDEFAGLRAQWKPARDGLIYIRGVLRKRRLFEAIAGIALQAGGHGKPSAVDHMPEKSGFPSAPRGAGAERSGLPLLSFGTPAVG